MGMSNYIPSSALTRAGVCTSSTRPASPYEGQVIYTTDTDLLQIWNGTAWRTLAFATPTNGSILQTVSATTNAQVINTTNTYVDTGLTATITPISATSKVLVLVSQNGCNKRAGNSSSHFYLQLLRNSTVLQLLDSGGGYTGTSSDLFFGSICSVYLDSPSTTSAVTYKTQFRNNVNASSVEVQANSSASTITLMEIAA